MAKILVVGATGYVGGTVLAQLLDASEPSIHLRNQTFDVVVRKDEHVQRLQQEYGDRGRVRVFKWPGLHDTTFIYSLAEKYDIIVNAGTGFHAEGAIAFVNGQARRLKNADNATPWYINLSGCTNLATPGPARQWNDIEDGTEIFKYMQHLNAQEPYPQRTAELGVLAAGASTGVQAVSVNAPVIFGEGQGLFNRQGTIIPRVMNYCLQHGYGFKLNETANFDRVHVTDLAQIFVLLIRMILKRPDHGVSFIPSNEEGVIFSENGHILIKDINQSCLDVLFADGMLPKKDEDAPQQKEIRLVPLQDIADKLALGRTSIAARSWAGYKFTQSSTARRLLGWHPKHGDDAWKQDFEDELIALKENRRIFTFAGVIGAE